MMSWFLEKIEDLLLKYLDVTLENRYTLLSVGYILFFIWQALVYLFDGITAIFFRSVSRIDDAGLPITVFLFSAAYALFFLLVEPEHKRWFGACGILASVHLVCSVAYYYYVYVFLDVYDTTQFLYYTRWLSPLSMFIMTTLLSISAIVMCKMSFFRSYKRKLLDLYEMVEQDGKKTV